MFVAINYLWRPLFSVSHTHRLFGPGDIERRVCNVKKDSFVTWNTQNHLFIMDLVTQIQIKIDNVFFQKHIR